MTRWAKPLASRVSREDQLDFLMAALGESERTPAVRQELSVMLDEQPLRDWFMRDDEQTPPYTCKFCGAPSWKDPSEQDMPADYCHPEDHGSPEWDLRSMYENSPVFQRREVEQ